MNNICDTSIKMGYQCMDAPISEVAHTRSLVRSVPKYMTNAINNFAAHVNCLPIRKSVLKLANLSNMMASGGRGQSPKPFDGGDRKIIITNLLILDLEIWIPTIAIIERKD